MLPLFLVYLSEYTINTSLYPLLLYPPPPVSIRPPLSRLSSKLLPETHGSVPGPPSLSHPIAQLRDFYPTWSTLYQVGVFISRSSLPFFRVRTRSGLYVGSWLQCLNFVILLTEALAGWMPGVFVFWIVVGMLLWEGLLGGGVYVNTFANIQEEVGTDRRNGGGEGTGGGGAEEREFALAAVSVSDSAGIMIAGVVGLWLEGKVCDVQVKRERVYCRGVVGKGG